MKVILAKAHTNQLEDPDVKRELKSIAEAVNSVHIDYNDHAINFVLIKGIYDHSERKMITACLFVNKFGQPVQEIHGVLRLRLNNRSAQIAKSTIDFDEPFMGSLNNDEALLVHIAIPVKGLETNETFLFSDISGSFEDVRVTTC